MPESIQVGGRKIYKPGVYSRIDASQLGGKSASTGNLAIVGSFPFVQNDVPVEVSTPAELAALDPGNAYLEQIAKLAFTPSTQDGIGGANKIYLINVGDVTQAAYDFLDSAAAKSLNLASRVWGQKGNQTYVKLNTNATDANGIDALIKRGPLSETYPNMQSGVIAEVICTATDLQGADDTTDLTVDPTQFKWAWKKRLAALVGAFPARSLTFSNTDIKSDSTRLTFNLTAAAVNDIEITAIGFNELGIPKTLTATILGGGTGPITMQDGASDALWSELTSVQYETANAADDAYAGFLEVDGFAFSLTPTDYNFVSEIADFVNNAAGMGYAMTAKTPLLGSIPSDEIDKQTAVSVKSPAYASLRADLWAIVQALSSSAIIDPSRATGANLPPKHAGAGPATTEEVFLLGGTKSSVILSDWTAAFVELESEDVQVLWIDSAEQTVGSELITHCKNAGLTSRRRNGWMGAYKQQTRQDLYDLWTSLLNSQYISLCSHEIKVTAPSGKGTWLDPKFFALACSAVQCGTSIAEPMTSKRIAILDARAAWKPSLATDNDAISKGICAMTKDNLGWKILRSVTTYLTDDNPAYSEVSSFESIQHSIRRVWAELDVKVGNKNAGATAGQIAVVVQDELAQMVVDEELKAFKDIVITDYGTKFGVGYGAAAVEPINFFDVQAGVYRTGG